MQRTYSIYEAKTRFSEIIRTVKGNRRIVVTERGTPVAEVVPYQREAEESMSTRVERLTRVGAIVPAEGKFRALVVKVLPGASERFLKEDRGD